MNLDFYDPIDHAYLNLTKGDISRLREAKNPLMWPKNDEPIGLGELRLMSDPSYFYWTCKSILNFEPTPSQLVVLEETWKHPFPMWVASRGWGKSTMLAIYCWLKLLLNPGHKVVGVGAAFRQSKMIFDNMKNIWDNAPVLKSIAGKNDGPNSTPDKCTMFFNGGWAAFIPIGTGEKIRGMRANTILADEFSAMSPDIFETVISGFAAVSASPLQNQKDFAKRKKLRESGLWTPELEQNFNSRSVNQSIIAGTADYAFMHFAQYWRRYKQIIESGGEERALREVFPDGIPDDFSWRDYAIIRIPYELIPEGFLDSKTISKAKATIHSSNYLCEYGALFPEDSDGFFKRTLIESCVVSEKNKINGITFDAKIVGDQDKQYVYGLDPAAINDNLSIVILELHDNHTRVVYCWCTNLKDFRRRVAAGLTDVNDYYGFCARKLRELMRVFPCVGIAMDSQGGGVPIEEALQDKDKIREGELPILRVVNPEKPFYTDGMQGLHILNIINFADAKWTSEANHGLRKDMEDKVLLFPKLDPVLLAIDLELNSNSKGEELNTTMYDTLEDCSLEIEELKNELCTIIMSTTGTGQGARDRWDTPETKTSTGKKGRLRKDRYSALVMANMVARQRARVIAPPTFGLIGGVAHEMRGKPENQRMYTGNTFFNDVSEKCFIGISRRDNY